MKFFISYLLKVIIILFTISVILDLGYTYVFKKSIPRNKIRYAFSLKNKHYDALFLGSSRVNNTIVTSEFKKENLNVLNMGISGASLGDNYWTLKLLKENNVTFDKVFIQIDYLYNQGGVSFSEANKTTLLPLVREKRVEGIFKNIDNDFSKNYYIPFYRYMKNSYRIGFREFVSSLLSKKSRIALDDGYTPLYGVSKLKEASLPKEIKESSKVYSELNNLVISMGLEPIYFISPYCSKLIDNRFIQKLNEKVSNFHDYSREIRNDEFFHDCGHLNDKGARLFTLVLVQDFFKN